MIENEGIRLFRGWGKTNQIEIKSSHQGIPIGFLGWIQVIFGKIIGDEGIDRVADPSFFSFGYFTGGRRLKSPVLCIFSAFLNPSIE